MKKKIADYVNHNERMKEIEKRKKHNKIIINIKWFIVALLVVCFFVSLISIESYVKHTYKQDGVIIWTDAITNEVSVVTIDCNEWTFVVDNVNEYQLDDVYRITFNDNNTINDIYDDVIINAKKIK